MKIPARQKVLTRLAAGLAFAKKHHDFQTIQVGIALESLTLTDLARLMIDKGAKVTTTREDMIRIEFTPHETDRRSR